MAEGNHSNGGDSRHDPYAALRVPAFRRLLCGGIVLQLGSAAQSVAVGWEIYRLTGQPLALGLAGLVQALPMFLFTLPAGYLADVYDRRRLMLAACIGNALLSLGLAAFCRYGGPVWWLFGLLFLDSTFQRLGGPARTALLPQLVPATMLEGAVKWRTSLGQIAGMAGPAIGGLILATSVPAVFLLGACAATTFAVVLVFLRTPPTPRLQGGRMHAHVGEGIRFVWRSKTLLGAVSLDLFAVLLGGSVYLLPIYARDLITVRPLGASPEQVMGWLRAAPAAGALCMALLLAHLPPMRRAGRNMLWAVAGFGAATVVFGLSNNFWLSWGMLFLTGFCDNISVVVRHTLVQICTPNAMRGRVSAVNSIFIGSSNEVGGFESGVVAQAFGPVASVVSGGIGTLLVVAGWARLFPGLRSFGAFAEHAVRETAAAEAEAEQEAEEKHG